MNIFISMQSSEPDRINSNDFYSSVVFQLFHFPLHALHKIKISIICLQRSDAYNINPHLELECVRGLSKYEWNVTTYNDCTTLVKNKCTKMYLKYILC